MPNARTVRQVLFLLLVRPIFPALQWLGRISGTFVRAKTVEGPHLRQPYLIGHLQTGISLDELRERLRSFGFFPERVAYPDPGQLLSMRKLSDERPDCQYHLRVFKDREVRGHFEYTPEDHPFRHMNEELFEPRSDEFKSFLGPFLGA